VTDDPSKKYAGKPAGPQSLTTPDVTISSPLSNSEVRHLYDAWGTAVAGVAEVNWTFDYDFFNGTNWVAAPQLDGKSTPQSFGPVRVWDAGVPVNKDGKNGVFKAFNQSPGDGGESNGITIKASGVFEISADNKGEKSHALKQLLGLGPSSYTLFGIYPPAVGSDVIGVLALVANPTPPVKFVEAVAADGIWVMLFNPPPGTNPPYSLTPYLLDGNGNVKAVANPRLLT
jgi:hypothetical protein